MTVTLLPGVSEIPLLAQGCLVEDVGPPDSLSCFAA